MRLAFLGVAVAAVAVVAAAVYQQRFEYIASTGYLLRVDRMTGRLCAIPLDRGAELSQGLIGGPRRCD